MIRVRVIAPTPALRAGLASLLGAEPGFMVLAEPADQDGSLASPHEADVIVMATIASQPAWLEQPHRTSLAAPILYLRNEPADVRFLVDSGIGWGLLPLDASATQLQAAVRALAAGLQVAAPSLLSNSSDPTGGSGPLTERETEVLGLLSRGLANKQIAAQLEISEHTVKFHVSSIYTKLGATNRTQAVREGLQNGWIVL